MSPQLLTSLNFTWLLEYSPVPEASIELPFLWKRKSSPTFDHSPSRDQQTSVQLHFFFFFFTKPQSVLLWGKKNTCTAVSIEKQPGGTRSAV